MQTLLLLLLVLLSTLFNFQNVYSELQIQIQPEIAFPSTIPVVDMKDFENIETRQKFIDEMSKALHDVGFFAVINPGVDVEALKEGYNAIQQFFQASAEEKYQIFDPKLNGQRGYVPSETAQGQIRKDFKEFIHIGKSNNLWPAWMDLQSPMENLLVNLDKHSHVLQEALSLALGQDINFLKNMTTHGESLLRALHYPANPAPGQFWAAPHTDIVLFTILPMATEEGLQIYHQGNWIDVRVPPDAFIVNGGDMLENMTNGHFKSCVHRVVSKPNLERYSIVYFIHPRDMDAMDPLEHCIEITGGIAQFPKATRLDMLAHRLVELGLASQELKNFDATSGYMERIETLVLSGHAAPPVLKTYRLWQELKNKK